METVVLKDIPRPLRVMLLNKLGYDVNDQGLVVNFGDRKPVFDKYINEPVKFENMDILPTYGLPLIIDDNPLSLASYFEEFPKLANA